jgi:multidrug efflux pump subunit AcrB
VALALIAAIAYGFSRVPSGFLPIEDQGYMIALVQLPEGASLERTQQTMDQVFETTRKTPGVAQVITIAGVSALDNSATLANAGVAYIILKDWSERGKGEDLLALFKNLNASLATIEEASIMVMPPPPIQGVGNDAGFTLQIELRDGSFDLAKLQSVTNAIVANAKSQSALQLVLASFRANVPQYTLEVDRVKTQTVGVSLDQVFSVLGGYLGSSYVDQFNRFGRSIRLPMVLASRPVEYDTLPAKLQLETAVGVRPLDPTVVLGGLQHVPGMRAVVTAIQRDPELLDLLRSPLLVSMLTLTYAGVPEAQIHATSEAMSAGSRFLSRSSPGASSSRRRTSARGSPGARSAA